MCVIVPSGASARKLACGFRKKADAKTKSYSIGLNTIFGPML